MNKNLLILGAGGHGRVVKEVAEAMGSFQNIDFLDDNSEIAKGKLQDFEEYKEKYSYAFPAFGASKIRMQWLEKLEGNGFTIPVLIHPTAYISPTANIELGSIIAPKAVIHTNVIIEKGCIISAGVIIDHDSRVKYGCHIDCGAIVKSNCTVEARFKVDSANVVASNEILTMQSNYAIK